jgi:hypothetical protein
VADPFEWYDRDALRKRMESANFMTKSFGALPTRALVEEYARATTWADHHDGEGAWAVGLLLLGSHCDALRSAITDAAPWIDDDLGSTFDLVVLGDPRASSPTFRGALEGAGIGGQRLIHEWTGMTTDWQLHGQAVAAESKAAAHEYGIDEADLPCLLTATRNDVGNKDVKWQAVSFSDLDLGGEAGVRSAVDAVRRAFSRDALDEALDGKGRVAIQRAVRTRLDWLRRELGSSRPTTLEELQAYRARQDDRAWQVSSEVLEASRRNKDLRVAQVRGLLEDRVKLPNSAWATLGLLLDADPKPIKAEELSRLLHRLDPGAAVQPESIPKSVVPKLKAYFSISHGNNGYGLDTPFVKRSCWGVEPTPPSKE